MSLTNTAGRGAFWQISGGGAQAAIRLGSSMVLARQLDPSDFGIFGVAHMVYGVFELLSANGMTSGLIAKDDPSQDDISTCFWCILIMRVVLYLLVVMLAPFLAGFIDNPKLVTTIRVVSLLILITGFGAVSQSIIVTRLQFKQLAIIRFWSIVVESLLAVVLVLTTDLKYWALIVSMLISAVFMNIAIVSYAKWLPKYRFSLESFKYLYTFGINNMGASITSYIASNLDYILVAKLLGTKMLGYYEFAYRIPHLVNEKISNPVGIVIFSAMAKVKADNQRIKAGYFTASKYIAWVTFPALGGLALLSPLVVNLLWGEKWLVIILPMRILCLSAAINCVMDLSKALFLCKERPDLPFKFEIYTLSTAVVSVSLLGYYLGLTGVACGMVIAKTVSFISGHRALLLVDSSIVKLIKPLSAPTISTLSMLAVVYAFERVNSLVGLYNNLNLLLCVAVGVASYIGIIRILFVSDYLEISRKIKDILFAREQNSQPLQPVRSETLG